MLKKSIAVIGTLDTKGEEVCYISELIRKRAHIPIRIDVGILPSPAGADYSNSTVARLAGWRLSDLVKLGRRDQIMAVMSEGAAKVLLKLLQEEHLDGVIGLGGNQGTTVAAMAMRDLPFGFPKYLVSTVASGNIRPYVEDKDIGVVFSVGDFLGGPNPVTESILTNAVAAVVGMAEHGARITVKPGVRTIAVTALGNTEPAASRAVKSLRAKGFQVVPFHASGAGGSAMEELIEAGIIQGVLDLTPHELTEEVVGAGAYQPVNPGRLTAAGRKGIPQVVSTGGMEYLCFGPRESIPMRLRKRKIYMHNPFNANVKVSRNEMAHVGGAMAERLNAATGPTAILIPLKGWSIYGAPGGVLYDGAGNRALLKTLKDRLRKDIHLQEIDAHINDGPFVDACVNQLIAFMEE